jgi:hypothetical protein
VRCTMTMHATCLNLGFNTRKAPENSPPGVNFLSPKYSTPVVISPLEVDPTFIENSDNPPPEVDFFFTGLVLMLMLQYTKVF